MALRDGAFAEETWHHCFNVTVEKRLAFVDTEDYQRFLEILYLANDTRPLRRNTLGSLPLEEVFHIPRDGQIVGIGAFALLPGHFHLLLRQTAPGGITAFMRKLGTAYTMYFNSRYERAGNLFLKPFRSRMVPEMHLQRALGYIHASPAALYEREWKTRHIVDPQFLGERIMAYPYSSLKSHAGMASSLRPILDAGLLSGGRGPSGSRILEEALSYESASLVP